MKSLEKLRSGRRRNINSICVWIQASTDEDSRTEVNGRTDGWNPSVAACLKSSLEIDFTFRLGFCLDQSETGKNRT